MRILDVVVNPWFEWIWATSIQVTILVAVVAILALLLKSASSRLLYALWLIVLIKLFLPPSLESPISLRNCVVEPIRSNLSVADTSHETALAVLEQPLASQHNAETSYPMQWIHLLFFVWAAVAALFAIAIVSRYRRIVRMVDKEPPVLEGPFRIAMEAVSLKLKLRRIPELHFSDSVACPLLLGVFKPRVVIPSHLVGKLNQTEITALLTHELVHWRRLDPLVGWFQTLAQVLFWFHPLVWWANNQLRQHRECACDEVAMLDGSCDPQGYGETLLRVLSLTRARQPALDGLIGVFGSGAKLVKRVEKIMNFEKGKGSFGWKWRVVILAAAVFLLPMSTTSSQDDDSAADTKTASTPYPQIVETVPKNGAIDVDPNLESIVVKFDRDMGKGMSWTGGPPLMPNLDKSRKIQWKDKRTCVMPVKLESGKIYRVGINAKDFLNFQSEDGTPVPPDVIAFTTKGASKGLQANVKPPKIEKIRPALNATDVSPKTAMLKVTFNVAMSEGMSWVGGGEHFPEIPEGKRPKWSKDGKSCMLPVKLKPNWEYHLGLNSFSHNNFQNKYGIPLKPVEFKFSTGDK